MVSNHSTHHDSPLGNDLKREVQWKSVAFRLLMGLGLLVLVVYFARHSTEEIKATEDWIASHGMLGRVVYLLMLVLFASVFVPDTAFAIAAGALFGIGWGYTIIVTGCVVTAALNYFVARTLLRPRIEAFLEHRPKLRAIKAAANREGLRLQLLLRLSPLNPVMVNYILGASGVPFSTFILATIGMFPALFVEVYFGYVASHVTKAAGGASDHSTLHTVVIIAGFAVCVVLMIFIARIASKALADAEANETAA